MFNNIYFSWCNPEIEVLFGIFSAPVTIENTETEEQKDGYMLSFGFLIFRIDLIF